MGAVIGGLLEYSSMAVGIKALYLIAMLAYLGAWIGLAREKGARRPRAAPAAVAG